MSILYKKKISEKFVQIVTTSKVFFKLHIYNPPMIISLFINCNYNIWF